MNCINDENNWKCEYYTGKVNNNSTGQEAKVLEIEFKKKAISIA